MAPKILELVKLRNKIAHQLGYKDFFQMQLELQEVDKTWLFQTFDEVVKRSNEAYKKIMDEIEWDQMLKYSVKRDELGPWAWSDPFCQEDPMNALEVDQLLQGVDVVGVAKKFYEKMGYQVQGLIDKSDLYERKGKNQHAFCIHIDREGDVRTLQNIQPNFRWLETVLHEFGHGVYDQQIDKNLPWLLREPSHMIPTEAMALLAGRLPFNYHFLKEFLPYNENREAVMKSVKQSLKRRQLIFSRFAILMTHFESELYRDPDQNLNALWWTLVKKYQSISTPKQRDFPDWASKYHLALAPVYYFSYLIGELFASELQESMKEVTGEEFIWNEKAGAFLKERLFSPGASYSWSDLLKHVTGKPLTCDAWIREIVESK